MRVRKTSKQDSTHRFRKGREFENVLPLPRNEQRIANVEAKIQRNDITRSAHQGTVQFVSKVVFRQRHESFCFVKSGAPDKRAGARVELEGEKQPSSKGGSEVDF